MAYWIVWLVICVVLIAVYSIDVLPILFGLAAGGAWKPTDRGMKKFNIQHGISILYEPNYVTAKYIKRYQIYQRTNEECVPVFVGEWTKRFQSAEYDISAFNKFNRLVGKKRIREFPRGARLTRCVSLPPETDYISLSVRRIDDKKITPMKRRRTLFYPLFALFAFAVAIDVAAILFVTVTFLSRVLGGFSADGFTLTASQWCLLLLLPAFLIALVISAAGLCYLFRQEISQKLTPCRRGYNVVKKACQKLLAKLKNALMGLRFVLGKGFCAIYNVTYAFFHNGFFRKVGSMIKHIYYAFRRLFQSSRKKRGVQNG